jgi:hypothetical protein
MCTRHKSCLVSCLAFARHGRKEKIGNFYWKNFSVDGRKFTPELTCPEPVWTMFLAADGGEEAGGLLLLFGGSVLERA